MAWFSFRKNPAKTFFTKAESGQIVEAIRQSELNTSGEIRVHLENYCPGDVFEHAGEVFHQLKMDQTVQQNGVLIYLAVEDHRFAIYAGKGINEEVPDNFWDHIVEDMTEQFKKKAFVAGLVNGIKEIGDQLQTYFPRLDDDQNELPDEISYG